MTARKGSSQRQSLIGRALRFLRRLQSRFSGPRVKTVQGSSAKTFLSLLVADFSKSSEAKLLSHLAERVATNWPATPNILTDLRLDMSQMSDQDVIARADRALGGNLHPSGQQPRFRENGLIDWSHNPAPTREWLLMMHRHAWWALWARAYQISSDEKYANAFVSQLNDWLDHHPMPGKKEEHREPWRLMECALRVRISWLPAFGAFFDAQSFDAPSKLRMLRALHDHGVFLSTFRTNRNHLVRESNGLLALSLTLPEFAGSSSWTDISLQRLDQEIREQVNPDGSHIEMSVGYQWLTIDEFEVTAALIENHDKRLPNADLADTLHRMYGFLAGVLTPGKTFPQLNDGFILWGADRLRSTAEKRGWVDIAAAAGNGAPDWRSRCFPNAGLHVMRSGWRSDGHYLIADAGPYGGPHGHEDMLSFECHAHGKPFIVDPGAYTYDRNDPYRNYFVGSQGHNTVLVDDCSQVRRWRRQNLEPSVDDSTFGVWRSEQAFDFFTGRYDEDYATFALQEPPDAARIDDVAHQRAIVFVKPDYWIVVDRLDARMSHCYDFLFHLAPEVSVNSEEGLALELAHGGDQKMQLLGWCSMPLTVATISGESAPIQGWYSPDHHKKTAAATIRYRAQSDRELVAAWLLMPMQRSAVEARLDVAFDAARLRCTVRVDHEHNFDRISVPLDGSSDVQIERQLTHA